nr:hypothetical protein [Tanacetum cinerariifolium]
MKAQVHVSKSPTIFDIQALPQKKLHCQIYQVVKHILRGRLLASFQDLEHKGGDTRSQGAIKANDSKIKIQDHWHANDHSNEFLRTRLQVSRKGFFLVQAGSVKRKKDENTTQTAANKVSTLADYGNVNKNNNLALFRTRESMAYPVVKNYIKNTWIKYGLVKSMTTTKGMFFFKFSSKDEMDALIENEGYSAIATKLSTPLMLDSYTSAMYTNLWDRSSYARSIVELRADVDLKDTIVFVVPKFIGEVYTTITIHVEYEWTPS